MPPFLDADAIVSSTIVRYVELHELLGSTNDRALELASNLELRTPALIAARLQTAGRGRGDHKWWAGEGALTFSLILDTTDLGVTQRDWPRLSLATAVAVCDALGRLAPAESLAIKWPNDVMLRDAKISGVLIESRKRADSSRDRLVIGVGVNVNNSWQSSPPDAASRGIALCDAIGKPSGLQAVLISFLQALERRIKQLADLDYRLVAEWQRLCATQGRKVEVVANGHSTRGRCEGITADGAILVRTSEGVVPFYSGSLVVVPS
jgi:BirA family biotin operon repressor/biotin-[acetyl-CoA-carboxylase] ligase